jgi:predicted flavoprotein YhiN
VAIAHHRLLEMYRTDYLLATVIGMVVGMEITEELLSVTLRQIICTQVLDVRGVQGEPARSLITVGGVLWDEVDKSTLNIQSVVRLYANFLLMHSPPKPLLMSSPSTAFELSS